MQELTVFFNALRSTRAAQVSSRLLNTADRDLGALLRYASDDEVQETLAYLGTAKRERIIAEIERMRRVRLPKETIARIAAHLATHVAGDHPLGPASRYFKPAH